MLIESWNIVLLGGLKARYRDQEISQFPTRKVAALLAYFAYYNDRSHTREELADRFWPELELEAARHNLRQTLFSLRRCLDAASDDTPLFFADRTTVQLNHERISTDVGRFERALHAVPAASNTSLQQQALIAATDLYHGELLPGHYEEWIFTERERLTATYAQALRQLLAVSEQIGDWERARETARRLIAVNNLDESAHQAAIRIYLATGNPGDARRQYETLAQLLRAEFGIAPSTETQELISSRITISTPAKSSPTFALPPNDAPLRAATPALPLALDRFFGRDSEIAIALQSLAPPESGEHPTLALPPTFGRNPGGKGGYPPISFPASGEGNGFPRFAGGGGGATTGEPSIPVSTRLLTLTGPGGAGKTRLAIEIAHLLTKHSGRHVYFATLTDLPDIRAVPMQLASALGLPPAEKAEPVERIIAHLSAIPAYLILDNFEHLVDEGRALVATLLQQAPALICLVTSRRRLGLAGEYEIQVPPLPTPLGTEAPDQLSSIPSVALYIDRVRQVRPQFALTPENARAVAALCDRLEGIPLAIELAAARSSVLAPTQLLTQLENRFRILVAPRRPGTIARHRSLRAALDLSYDLLVPETQRLFRQLVLFRGGWTLEAAEAVTGQPTDALLSGMEQLCECSLITTTEMAGGIRFRMLETLREYGQERATPEELALLAQRHTSHYLRLAEAATPLYHGPAATIAFDALEADHDNLRTALVRAAQQDDQAATLLRFVGALWRFWLMRGHYQEGRDWLQAALDGSAAGDDERLTPLRAGALYGQGMLALAHGDIVGQTALERALELYRSLDDRRHIAIILLRLGRLATSQDDDVGAHHMLQEGLEIGRQLQDKHLIAEALYQLSYEARERGNAPEAERLLRECLPHARQIGNREFQGDVLNWLGTVALLQGDTVSARHHHNQAIALYRESNYDKGLGWALLGLGNVERAEHRASEARSVFADSLRCFHRLNDRVGMFHALLRCAYVEAMEDRYLRAAYLLAAAESLRRETGFLVQPSERPDRETCLANTQAALDPRVFALAQSDAGGWTPAEMVRYALQE